MRAASVDDEVLAHIATAHSENINFFGAIEGSAEELVQRLGGENPGGPGTDLVGGRLVHAVDDGLGKRAELECQQFDEHLSSASGETSGGASGFEHFCDGHVGLLRLGAESGDQVAQRVVNLGVTDLANITQEGGEDLPAVRALQEPCGLRGGR